MGLVLDYLKAKYLNSLEQLIKRRDFLCLFLSFGCAVFSIIYVWVFYVPYFSFLTMEVHQAKQLVNVIPFDNILSNETLYPKVDTIY